MYLFFYTIFSCFLAAQTKHSSPLLPSTRPEVEAVLAPQSAAETLLSSEKKSRFLNHQSVPPSISALPQTTLNSELRGLHPLVSSTNALSMPKGFLGKASAPSSPNGFAFKVLQVQKASPETDRLSQTESLLKDSVASQGVHTPEMLAAVSPSFSPGTLGESGGPTTPKSNNQRDDHSRLDRHRVSWKSPLGLWYCLVSVAVVLFAGLASGLTLGLMSLDPVQLKVLACEGTEDEKRGLFSTRFHVLLWNNTSLASFVAGFCLFAFGGLLVDFVYNIAAFRAAMVSKVIRRHHLLLVTLLLANAIALETLPIFLDRLVPSWAAILLSVTAILLFGEIIPQAICTGRNQLKIAQRCAPLVNGLIAIFFVVAWPIAKLLDYCFGSLDHHPNYARAHLKALIRMHERNKRNSQMDGITEEEKGGDSHSALGADEVIVIEGALDMAEKTLQHIMLPIENVFMLSNDTIMDRAVFETVLSTGHSRVPVYKGNRNNIKGMILTKSLLAVDPCAGTKAEELIVSRRPIFASPRCSLYDILNEFQKGHSHIAFVTPQPDIYTFCLKNKMDVSPEATLLGIVTLEDVIEELIQEEIYDEFDQNVNRPSGGQLKTKVCYSCLSEFHLQKVTGLGVASDAEPSTNIGSLTPCMTNRIAEGPHRSNSASMFSRHVTSFSHSTGTFVDTIRHPSQKNTAPILRASSITRTNSESRQEPSDRARGRSRLCVLRKGSSAYLKRPNERLSQGITTPLMASFAMQPDPLKEQPIVCESSAVRVPFPSSGSRTRELRALFAQPSLSDPRVAATGNSTSMPSCQTPVADVPNADVVTVKSSEASKVEASSSLTHKAPESTVPLPNSGAADHSKPLTFPCGPQNSAYSSVASISAPVPWDAQCEPKNTAAPIQNATGFRKHPSGTQFSEPSLSAPSSSRTTSHQNSPDGGNECLTLQLSTPRHENLSDPASNADKDIRTDKKKKRRNQKHKREARKRTSPGFQSNESYSCSSLFL